MVFERAILQQLGIEATVTGSIDVLEERARERRADGRAGFVEVDLDVVAAGDARNDEG